jgi:hypothetical protein
MSSLCCCGMPLCRLATEIEPQSTTIGSMRSTGCNAARSTSISRPTPCFLTGAHGPRGLLGLTWMMLWRRLLTWHSLPSARRTWLLLRARPSHCTLSKTTLTQSGRLALMRWPMSFRFIITVVGRTWPDMPSICFSCNMTLSTSSQSSDAVLLAMPRKSRASPRRSAARLRRLVPCVSRSGTWRAAFVTRKRHFCAVSITHLSATKSYFGTMSFCGWLRSPPRLRPVSLRSSRP